MRICAGFLHQVQGTLRMVELYAPAMVAEELEQLANAIGAGRRAAARLPGTPAERPPRYSDRADAAAQRDPRGAWRGRRAR
ncbi:hypothetical protein G6F62_015562 [Rhizopus arrhizus]|nr:hypothetical protein G6F62_015562 [Rhizopus arrhizus]